MLKYRADIDGLRAFAVLSVVLYHFFPALVPGGFIGVDVFFVISGYLITSIIINEKKENRFSYLSFYIKRIIRIFPSLLVVLLITLIAGWFILLQNDFKSLGKHIFSSAFFMSNITLLRESGYFDTQAIYKPLLNMWSLGVEEQFYIVWPLVLVLILKIKNIGLPVLTGMFIASLLYGVGATFADSASGYYSPVARFWELMSGALIAIFYEKKQLLSNKSRISNVLFVVGFLILLSSNFIYSGKTQYPGIAALYPILGAVLVIITKEDLSVKKWLSSRPLVFIGLISYPLYLWHWPVLSFLNIISAGNVSAIHLLMAMFVIFLLSVVTYFFIDKKVRNGKGYTIKALVFVLLTSLAGLFGLAIYATQGFPDRKINAIANEYSKVVDVYEFFNYKKLLRYNVCHSVSMLQTIKNGCVKDDSIFIWGDSYAAALYNGIAHSVAESNNKINISQMTDGNGPPFFVKGNITDSGKDLSEANEQRLAQVRQSQPRVIIMAWMIFGSNSIYDMPETLRALQLTVQKIKQVSPASKIVIIGPVPEWNGTLIRQAVLYYQSHNVEIPVYTHEGLREGIMDWDRYLNDKVPGLGVKYISAYRAMCDDDGCRTRIGHGPQNLTAVDWGHLTSVGSIFLMNKIYSELIE